MRVPRPFDPEEVDQPQGKESQKHLEREEKPLATEDKRQSEDYHGGDESTESLPDSPNEGSEEQEEQQKSGESSASNSQQSQSSNGEQSQQSDTNGSSTSNASEPNSFDDKQSQSSSENNNQQSSESQQSQSQQSGSNESDNGISTNNPNEKPNSDNKQSDESQQSSSETKSSESSEQSSSKQSEEQSSDQSDNLKETDNEQEETSDSTSQEANGESGETSNDTSNAKEEGDASDDASDTSGQNDETFDSEEEEQEVSNSDEESEYQVNSGTYNTNQVFTYVEAKSNTKLSRALYDFIEYVADETKVYNNLSTDYYEPKKLMLRRYQGRSLNASKSGKVRETIVVLLDNSGSMDWVREHVLETARALIQRHDAEIYFTPNGYIETQLTKQGEKLVKHENVINKIVSQQLKVLYVGDYDGANTPIELSWKTKVFWLCPESRYRRFRSHKWVHYDESAFRGFFARTYNANEMVQALKRFSGFAQFTRYWHDQHEREVFHDD